MQVELSHNEMWKILDAIKAYSKDYCVTGAVEKTLKNIESKFNKILKE